MGIGFCLIVRPQYVDSIRKQLAATGIEAWSIGEVEAGPKGVEYVA
ncbi:MAG TPA: hypothetical protein VL132_24295 [Planctomycetaceae bacterium]|nr:hypothetical protein [Planctomycetaceae bacterium]